MSYHSAGTERRAHDDANSSSGGSNDLTPRFSSFLKDTDSSERAPEELDTPRAVVGMETVADLPPFEFDLPEHLPSSPMCPANPKHKLKGKGICVVSSVSHPP